MRTNRVKKILREGGLALGTYTGGIADPQIVEIIGHAGFDAAFIDMEHTSFDLRDVQLMVMAAERVGITPIVLQLPHISNAHAAREAMKAVRYPPLGARGMAGASRASDYGKIALKDHLEQSNREITLAVMIEDLPAVEDIEAIASIEGIDIVAVGPSDMSRALGVSGTSDHPKLVDVVHRVADAVRKGGIARLALPMNHAALPRNAAQLRELGVGYCNCAPSPEVRMLKSLQAQVAEARA
jgi:2-keto-3-deoxy-L-rhamnonate aldolase RhmA